MNAADRSARNERALDLHLAGSSYQQIAAALDLPSKAAAQKAVEGALAARLGDTVPSEAARVEIARLDAMLVGLWGAASAGQAAAVDRVIRIGERRAALMRAPDGHERPLREAFDVSAANCKHLLPSVDDALVEAGRKIADRIDQATATAEGQELTKALYLTPHLMNILGAMLATPASRAAAGKAAKEAGGGKVAQMRAVHSGAA